MTLTAEARRDAAAAAAIEASLSEERAARERDANLLAVGFEGLEVAGSGACADDEVALMRLASAAGLPGNSCASVRGTKYCDMAALREVCPVACELCLPVATRPPKVEVEDEEAVLEVEVAAEGGVE